MLRGRKNPDKAESKISPSIQFPPVVFCFTCLSVGYILRLAPLLVLRWLPLSAGANASFKSIGKEWTPLTDNSQQKSQICLHWKGLDHISTIEPSIDQEMICTRTPRGLNFPRTTLMLKWKVRAVGREGGETDGETAINVPQSYL